MCIINSRKCNRALVLSSFSFFLASLETETTPRHRDRVGPVASTRHPPLFLPPCVYFKLLSLSLSLPPTRFLAFTRYNHDGACAYDCASSRHEQRVRDRAPVHSLLCAPESASPTFRRRAAATDTAPATRSLLKPPFSARCYSGHCRVAQVMAL